MDAHWGDIVKAHDAGSGIAAIERQQMTKPRPLEIDSPSLYRPSSAELASHESACSSTRMNLSLCRRVLKQHIAESFARAGFHGCDAECLETLTDVLCHYLAKVFQLLRVGIDSHGPDMPAVFQVFTELGLNSLVALEDYCKL